MMFYRPEGKMLGRSHGLGKDALAQDKEYDEKVDIYAIGVLAFFLLSGRRPFDHPNRAEKKRMIIHDPLQFPSPTWDKISKEAKEFIEGMMKKKSGERMSASEAIKHPWIKRASQVQQARSSTRVSLAPRVQHTRARAPSTSLSVPLHRQYLAHRIALVSLSLLCTTNRFTPARTPPTSCWTTRRSTSRSKPTSTRTAWRGSPCR